MIEHEPWIGDLYKSKEGIDRQLIAIVGHSHWIGEESKDSDQFTIDVVKSVIEKHVKIKFSSQLTSYFDFNDSADFLNRVIFFNFLPACVGNEKERYKKGSKEEIERARKRFTRIIRENRPHKVLVFSNSPGKGWRTLPNTDEEKAGDRLFHLGPGSLKEYTWGTYRLSGHTILAFGIRHPQGSNSGQMKKAVRHILAI